MGVPNRRNYPRTTSTSSDKVKDDRAEEIKAARIKYLWGRLRDTILDTVNASLENDAKERHVSHGIHFYRQVMHRSTVTCAFLNTLTEDYYTLDGQAIRIYNSSGMKKDIIMPSEELDHLCHIRHINSFVAWKRGASSLYLYGDDFELYSQTEAASDIYHVLYNEPKEEIIVCGNGYLQSFVFRFGNRHMISRRTRMEHELLDGRQVELVALEDTASSSQRCFIAFDNSVCVFQISDTKFLTWKKNLHSREITALLFFNPLKYLITASFDGSIKVWSTDWKVQFVFVGHTKAVHSLALYPWGSQFISVSADSTLRVWSLEVFDQMDKQDLEEPVTGLVTGMGCRNFCTYSEHSFHMWTVEDLHKVHTIMGYEVKSMKCTSHPNFPTRVIAICKDSAVRILTPGSGDVITTLLLDPVEDKIVDVAYAIADELLFVVLEGGDILKCSTSTNPAVVLSRWEYPDISLRCNYLLMYEYVIGNQSNNPWKNIARAFAAKHLEKAVEEDSDDNDSSRSTPLLTTTKTQDKTLLLGGRKDGYLCVLNFKTGEMEFEIEGHGSKGVLSMVANSPDDQVVSAGSDNVIKVWRLFPYSVDALSPTMSFYCSQTPLHMCVMTGKLGVAFHEHASATYSVVVYNINAKSRKDHSPEDDHTDTITALTACQRMKLFASSSLDGTVKVWSDTNKLVRHLKLNATPHCLEFVDSKGTLLVGVAKSIHRIDCSDALPRVYRFKQVTMRFTVSAPEPRIKFDSHTLKSMTRVDLKRLQTARAAYRFDRYSDELSLEEQERISSEEKLKRTEYDAIIAKQEDVAQVRDGELKAKDLPPRTRQTRSEAFIRYLSIFYDRKDIKDMEETCLRSYSEYNQALYQHQKSIPSMELQVHLFRHVPALRKIIANPHSSLIAIAAHANRSMASYLTLCSSGTRTHHAQSSSTRTDKFPGNHSAIFTPHHSNTLKPVSADSYTGRSQPDSSNADIRIQAQSNISVCIDKPSLQAQSKTSVLHARPSSTFKLTDSTDSPKSDKVSSRLLIPPDSDTVSLEGEDFMPTNCFTESLARERKRNEAVATFENALMKRYTKRRKVLFQEDQFPVDTARDRVNQSDEPDVPHTKYEDAGFFPDAGRASPRPFTDLLKETGYNVEEDKPLLESAGTRSIYPSDPRGYIPNSVLVRLLFPHENQKEEPKTDYWRPPRLTDEQLAEIGQTRQTQQREFDLSRKYYDRWMEVMLQQKTGPKSIADLAEEKALAQFQLEADSTHSLDYESLTGDDESDYSHLLLFVEEASSPSVLTYHLDHYHPPTPKEIEHRSSIKLKLVQDYHMKCRESIAGSPWYIWPPGMNPKENTTADRVLVLSDDEEANNDSLLKKSPRKKPKKKKGKVSFGLSDESKDADAVKDVKFDRADFKPKSVSFSKSQDTGNQFLNKIGSILTRPATPPLATKVCQSVYESLSANSILANGGLNRHRRQSHIYPGRKYEPSLSAVSAIHHGNLSSAQSIISAKSSSLQKSFTIINKHKTSSPISSYTCTRHLNYLRDSSDEGGLSQSQSAQYTTGMPKYVQVTSDMIPLEVPAPEPNESRAHMTPVSESGTNLRFVHAQDSFLSSGTELPYFGESPSSYKPSYYNSPHSPIAVISTRYSETIKADLSLPREPTPEPIVEEAPKKKQPTSPRKPIKKLISSGPPPKPPKPKTPTPPPPKEPTPTPTPPPPPPTPLPEFITQFIGERWFDQYYPNCNSYTFPKPWTVDSLVTQMLGILRMADYGLKLNVIEAIRKLFRTEGFRNIKEVVECCFDVLSPDFNPPTSLDDTQAAVIKALLLLLKEFGCTAQSFYIELMIQFIDGDPEIRSFALEVLNSLGLNDRHNFLTKELDSWDTWALEGGNRKAKIGAMCKSWLDKWMEKFKAHLKEGIEMLRKGQAIHTRVGRGGLKKPASDKKAYTVTFNEPPSNSVIERATWIECINYFCEMQQQHELNKVKAQQQADEKLVEAKNTVLVLPKLQVKPTLVRLGELHTNATACRPERETALSTQYELRRFRKNANGEWALPPGQLYGFVPFIKQPMSHVYMNPFPSPLDKYDQHQQEPILITLKTSPKFFVQNESFPVPDLVM